MRDLLDELAADVRAAADMEAAGAKAEDAHGRH
jgi:hypothetical protein